MDKQQYTVLVEGDSMYPFLCHGDTVCFDEVVYEISAIKTGDVVLAKHPFIENKWIIKRVKHIQADRYFLVGDNPRASTDSRSFGPIKKEAILGVLPTKKRYIIK